MLPNSESRHVSGALASKDECVPKAAGLTIIPHPTWYFAALELAVYSPSRADGIDQKTEQAMRAEACTFAIDLSKRFRLYDFVLPFISESVVFIKCIIVLRGPSPPVYCFSIASFA